MAGQPASVALTLSMPMVPLKCPCELPEGSVGGSSISTETHRCGGGAGLSLTPIQGDGSPGGSLHKLANLAGSLFSKTTRLCHCSRKAAIDDVETNERGQIPMKLYLQNQVVGQTWSGAVVYLFLVHPRGTSVRRFICLLNWIKISLESAFLSFFIISREEESYQTVAGAGRPQRQLPAITKSLQSATTLISSQLPAGTHSGR